ncbi:FmdB family transcriptional regulator [Pandoraea terrae]|uniref:FmdB family transcriptional regulator n=1 Tax=Pandoraea terrae TaxID=1537710 RepID=A0A5E4TZ09_9BURK|nr:FmdB family zinc ribbon protein [Pandoraea terrae]VVD92811.1 FmdB family transcriptional regulator [Pandoraea terrae]
MPIYAYRCETCGFAKDVLQKMSDAPLSKCPECGQETFRKQVTAAGFQLKGSGWYVTDFRGGSNTGGTPAAGSTSAPAAAGASATAASGGESSSGASSSPESSSASTASPAGGSCGGGCACH